MLHWLFSTFCWNKISLCCSGWPQTHTSNTPYASVYCSYYSAYTIKFYPKVYNFYTVLPFDFHSSFLPSTYKNIKSYSQELGDFAKVRLLLRGRVTLYIQVDVLEFHMPLLCYLAFIKNINVREAATRQHCKVWNWRNSKDMKKMIAALRGKGR